MEDKEDNTGGSPMTEELIADFRDAFKTFDTDEDGYLSLKELGDLLISLGVPVTKEELTEMTNEIDIEGNGTIDFKEFILLMARKMRDYDNEDEYIEAFRIFDKNNDDLISKEEFKEAMTIIGQFVWGESPTDEDIAYMIKEADTDGDGKISQKEAQADAFSQVSGVEDSVSDPFAQMEKDSSINAELEKLKQEMNNN